MRRVCGLVVLSLVVGCGGGGAGKPAPRDAAADGHVVSQVDAPADLSPQGAGGASGAGGDAGAGGAAGSAAGTGGAGAADASVPDAATDVAGDLVVDAVDAAPRLVTVAFTGHVATIALAPDAGTVLGLDKAAMGTAVSGSFTYDVHLADDEPNDPKRGKYQRGGATAFTFSVSGHTVTGSGKALLETENLDPDTFRFLDGPQGDSVVRTMKLDGADEPMLKLGIAITDGAGTMLTSDALPDPFPLLDITNMFTFKISHTFSLMDTGGTLLMRLDTLASP